jgi:hypothetical protein
MLKNHTEFCSLASELDFDCVNLPRLVTQQVRLEDVSVEAGIAELVVHQSPGDAVHTDEAVPHVAALHEGRDVVLGQDGVAEGIQRQPNVVRKDQGQIFCPQ